MRRLAVTLVFALVTAILASTASASQVVSTSTVTGLKLGVNAKGEAMLTYTVGGKLTHVLAWGAENAIAPTRTGKQVAFTLQYDGGYAKYYTSDPQVKTLLADLRTLQNESKGAPKKKQWALAPKIKADYAQLAKLRTAATDYWKTFSCPAYTGPALADVVAACKAPDGSYWAVQAWQRQLPDYGVAPTAAQAAMEVHLSHWTGALPVLDVHTDWSYHKWEHLFGTFTYDGGPVYGFRSTHQGKPLDSFGRNVYVDSLGADYGGSGWQRVNSFLTHTSTGAFCYGVSPHGAKHLTGKGSKYRLTVMGPGVTPDVSVEVASPGAYDAAADATANQAIAALNDKLCKPN